MNKNKAKGKQKAIGNETGGSNSNDVGFYLLLFLGQKVVRPWQEGSKTN